MMGCLGKGPFVSNLETLQTLFEILKLFDFENYF